MTTGADTLCHGFAIQDTWSREQPRQHFVEKIHRRDGSGCGNSCLRQQRCFMPDESWYKDGLRFTCTKCGHCCTGDPGFVWVSDADLTAIAELRGEALEEVKAMYTKW